MEIERLSTRSPDGKTLLGKSWVATQYFPSDVDKINRIFKDIIFAEIIDDLKDCGLYGFYFRHYPSTSWDSDFESQIEFVQLHARVMYLPKKEETGSSWTCIK